MVIRRPYQSDLFDEEESTEKHTVIATNRGGSAEVVVGWYNQRGQYSENRIKELKIGFGIERIPCGQFEANAVFFRIGVLAYNVCRLFVLSTLDMSWHRHQVQTLRWKLYETAGKIVFYSGHIEGESQAAKAVCTSTFEELGICEHVTGSFRVLSQRGSKRGAEVFPDSVMNAVHRACLVTAPFPDRP